MKNRNTLLAVWEAVKILIKELADSVSLSGRASLCILWTWYKGQIVLLICARRTGVRQDLIVSVMSVYYG